MEKVSDGERRSRRGEREGFRERVLERENGGFSIDHMKWITEGSKKKERQQLEEWRCEYVHQILIRCVIGFTWALNFCCSFKIF